MKRTGIAVVLLVLVGLNTAWAQAPVAVREFPAELVTWVPLEEKPVFAGTGADTWDRKIRERGWILAEDGVYHLWYTGYNPEGPDKTMHLGYATSPDGLRWSRDPANPLAGGSWVEDMCVVHAGDTYYMFAEGKDDIAHLLTSADRVRWTERGPLDIRLKGGQPISAGPRGTPTAWLEDGVWKLLYERSDLGVWLATSRDLKVWTNVQDDPVLPMGPDAYDHEAVAVNQVLKRGGVYYAFYHANAHRPWKDWTTCVARSTDLVHWDKYKGNPLVDHNCSSGIVVNTPAGPRLYTMHPEVRVFRPGGSDGKAARAR